MSGWKDYEKIIETVDNKVGTAEKNQEVYEESIQGKLNGLTSTGQSIWNNILNSDELEVGIDLLTSFLNIIDKLTKSLGGLGTLELGVGLFAGIKNFGIFKTWYNDLSKVQSVISNISNVSVFANGATRLLNTASLTAMTTAVSGLSKEQALLALSTKNLTNAQKEQVLIAAGIIATEDEITASAISQALAKSTLSATEKESLLTKLGLIDATTLEAVANATCTKEALLSELAKKGIVGADADAIISSIGLATANGAQTVSFDLLTASIWANIKALGKWLITNPVGWAILGGTAIFGLVKAYDALTDSSDEVKNRTNDLMSSFSSAISKANENAKSVESIASRYEELSKGVNNLGENVSLTTDEYSEYNDIVNQIAEMFPTLISGYTDEGNAILTLKGNVEQLRDAYKEAQQEAYNMLITSGKTTDGNDIIKNWDNLHDTDFFAKAFDLGAADVGGKITTEDAIKQLKEFQDMTAETYREIERITSSGSRKEISGLTDIQKDIGYGSYLYKALGIDEQSTDQEIGNAKKQAQILVQTYNAEIESALNDVESLANAYLMTNDDYSSLSEQSKTAASLIVNSLNEDIANGFKSKEDVGVYVAEIVSMIKDNPDMNNALVGLFSLDTTNMSVDDIKTKVDGYIKTIANILHEDENEVKVRLGFDDSNTDTLVNNVKVKLQDSFDNKVGELSLEDLDIAANNLEIPDGVTLSWDELITKIQEYKDNLQNTDETQIDKKLEELSSQLDNIQTAYSSLMSATDQYNETGYITIDQLQSLISNGSEFLDYLIDEDGNLKTDTESMQELTKARLVAMEAQVQQGLIDNITNIKTESDANVFLASTNYELADSYKMLASASIGAWKVQALNNGLDKSVVNEVLEKYNTDSKKISDLFSKANIGVEYNFDDVVGKSSSSSSSSSNSSSESETIIDFAEQRLNELNDLIDETKENIEQLEGSASKNNIIDSLVGVNNSKLSTLQQVHDLYEDMANQYLAKIPNEYKDLAKNGGIEIDKFVGDSNIADAINDYQSWADKVDDVNSEMLELKQTLKDLELDKFNNIKDDFEDMYSIIDKNKSKINDVVGLLEAQGQNIGDAFYKELISETETQISNLKDERIRLSSQMNYALNNGIENGSNEWKEMYDTLQDVDSSIISCEKDIADFQKSLNQLHWDNLEKLENQFSSINDEIGNLNNLLDEDTVSADGKFTSNAITQIGLLAQQYELARTEVEQYSEEIDYLNQLYKNGSISTNDYNDKLLELQNAQWDSISLSEEAKDAILDLAETRVNEVIDAINEETDAYKEMIDKQKESLQAEKDLYDYKKSIAEKESEITAIKRRVNAMMGSDDASTIAEREKLEAQLADLTSDLEDYKYEHSVELRQDALDKELEDFEKAQDSRVDILEDSLKDEESILQSSIKEAKLRANEIANVLLKLEQKQGIAINSYIINPWKSGVGAIAGYNQALNSSTSNFIAKLNGIKINIQNTQTQANNMARTIMSAFNISNNSGVYEAISKVRQNLYNTSVESINLKNYINSALNSTYGNGAVNSINNVRDAANKAGSSVNGLRYEINQLSKSIPDLTTNMTAFATGAYAASSYKDLLDMIKRNEAKLSAQSGRGNLPSAGINNYLPFPMFAEGGVVNGKSNKLAQGFGEDVTIFAKKGERILSLEQTKSFEEMVKNLPKVTPVLDNLVKNIKLPNFDFSNIGRNNISPIINVDAGITVQGNVDKNFAKEFENLQNNLTKNVTSKIANSLEKLGVQKNNCRPL